MEDSTSPPQARRRSSIAYDPARDIFRATEELPSIKEFQPTNTLHETTTTNNINSTMTDSDEPPLGSNEISNVNGARKRSRSGTPHHDRQFLTSPHPPTKRQRPSISPASRSPRRENQSYNDTEKRKNGARKDPREVERPRSVADLPRIKRQGRDDGQRQMKRNQHTPSAYSRRDIESPRSPDRRRQGARQSPPFQRSISPRRRSRSPAYRRRTPSPRRPRSPSPIRASPPPEEGRVRKRAGGGARVNASQLEAVQRRQAEREREIQQIISTRGVQDVSNQFYNQRPEWVKERGRDWRRNESKIKGLRSFNNWIKSAMIQKFSPDEPPVQEERGWGQEEPEVVTHDETQPLLVLDIGCGKGGDLGKWQQAPQAVGLYVGLDPAEQSVAQARDRYIGMRRGRRPIFDARFVAKDCFGEWIGDVPIVQEVGIDGSVGPGGNMMAARWGKTGGFDVVTMMFTMHYSFENEQKARMMLKNVAGSLKKGGRLIGVCPNSDIISSRVAAWHQKRKDEKVQSGENGDATHASNGSSNTPPPAEEGEVEEDADDSAPSPRWGNSLYNVKFTGVTPPDGVFRPATGWKYTYWMEEAVDVPEYVVPWEAFRALAEDYNLEQRYRKSFLDIWESDNNDPILGPLAVRMGVRKFEGGPLNISDEEREAVGFYHAFCFTKV